MRKNRHTFTILAVLAGMLAVGAGSLAERPPGAGGGGGGGGGGGDSGNEPPDYGDLFVLYRDADGIPILTEDFCQQPLAAEPFDGCIQIPGTDEPEDCRIIPVDPALCAAEAAYVIYTQEVDFGRLNEARSPETVFEMQLEEVIVNLGTAGCLSLDPAGRPVASNLVDEVVVSSTIDSPLQNLAMYRELMLKGSLGDSVTLPDDWLITAARALGGGLEKGGKATVDMVVYLNEILGLTEADANAMLGTTCIQVREEVKGVVQMVQKCFLDYSGFSYDRYANFGTNPGSLPAPPYIPAGDPYDGWFEYLDEVGPNSFVITQGPMIGAVPELMAEPDYYGTSIGAFVTAVDDTRAVINFMHLWPVPGEYATPVVCEVGADEFYDVSISEFSGLQVPVRMVAGTEGREGSVTVTNEGPAEASGLVMVIGVDTDGNVIGPLYRMEGEEPSEETIFDEPEAFTLEAGYSQSWMFYFSMDEPTTITWTATAEAEFDINLGNNSVTEETIVTRPKGGGGGGGGH